MGSNSRLPRGLHVWHLGPMTQRCETGQGFESMQFWVTFPIKMLTSGKSLKSLVTTAERAQVSNLFSPLGRCKHQEVPTDRLHMTSVMDLWRKMFFAYSIYLLRRVKGNIPIGTPFPKLLGCINDFMYFNIHSLSHIEFFTPLESLNLTVVGFVFLFAL